MIETAENLRAEFDISREDQDALAVQSHRRAVAAQQSGIFAQEIVPVAVPQRRATPSSSTPTSIPAPTRASSPSRSCADPRQHRPRLHRHRRQRQRPERRCRNRNRHDTGEGGSSRASSARAASRAGAVAGVPPGRWASGGPLHREGPRAARPALADMGVIELNEAFAAQALAVIRTWGLEPDDARLNPNGSGISLGHPVGATGARILATLLREMDRREARYGLETMCIGGGQGLAAVFERIA